MRVVDTSVAVKWFVAEELEMEARALIGTALCAPDLLMAEISNAAWKKWRRGEIVEDQARLAQGLVASLVELIPSRALAERALQIALSLDHPVYDCFYLALCEATERQMITADRRLVMRCAGTKFEQFLVGL